jgi:penicillin-binding protein 2
LIGKTGIESTYEKALRGRRGTKYVMVDVKHIVKGSFQNGKFDTLPIVGEELTSSIDLELQQYAELLMKNKIGSIVAIEPATGEILSLVSSPSYDPNLLTGSGKDVSNNYYALVNDKYKPLFNRPVMALYPPGSIIKIVQALIALQEGVIDSTDTRIPCVQDVVKCHAHRSPLGVKGSIQYSCNPFYYRVFNRIIKQGVSDNQTEDTRKGLAKWHQYMTSFGLGHKLGTDLYNEKGGNIPSVAYYDKRFKHGKWRFGNIYSLSIGQGEMGVVPLQMANLAAIMANRGYYYIPHIIKGAGKENKKNSKYLQRYYTAPVKKEYFELIIEGMEDVVRSGTATKAFVKDLTICGKTGTAQNPHGEDHSVFIAFAPKDNPKIAISVYVENAGFGGTWAAPIASLIIEKYLKGKIESEERQKMEKEIIEKNFMQPKKQKDRNLKPKTEQDEADQTNADEAKQNIQNVSHKKQRSNIIKNDKVQ